MPTSENLRVVIILPFRLPTLNQTYSMHWPQRYRLFRWIKSFVCESIRSAGDSQTQTAIVSRPFLTELQRQEYGEMTRANSSKRYASRKKLERKIKQSSKLSKLAQTNTRKMLRDEKTFRNIAK